MVNFHNPATLAQELVATENIWHAVDGIFIWEFFSTLHYEWDVFRGDRPYRWTIWIYSLSRVATLMAVIFNMISFDRTTTVNCQALLITNLFFSYVAFSSASLLIVLRIFAIWNKQTIVVLIAMGVWLADVVFFIYGSAQARSVSSDDGNFCTLTYPKMNKVTVMVSLVSDVVLLLVMLVGLFRLRLEMGNFGLGRTLWNQGLVWLLLATVAEVPPAVLYCLNLNGVLNFMFLGPNLIITTIAATRMYRSLLNRVAELSLASDTLGGTSRTISSIRFRSQPVPLKQMPVQVPLRTDSNEYPTSRSNSDTCADPHVVTRCTK